MSDVELVIRIPEEEYDIIKNSKKPMIWAEHLIANGTPLPKGHGDLIDISKLPVTYAYLGISDKPTDVVNYNCILSAKKIIRGR